MDEAITYIEQAKKHVAGDEYNLGGMMADQAVILHRQGKLEDATSEALGALKIYEKLGASKDEEDCKGLLLEIEREMAGELLEKCRLLYLSTLFRSRCIIQDLDEYSKSLTTHLDLSLFLDTTSFFITDTLPLLKDHTLLYW